MRINSHLRSRVEIFVDDFTKWLVELIDKAMKRNESLEYIIVYRIDNYDGILYKNNRHKEEKVVF
ncbi:hypothetical protein H8689_00755 [Lachnospiraceae bacterium NSJ-29]|uniref:Uncharacterized protein n=1 Tax=Wansuia hejianensis TaxID=2763667 RepID=A0A926F0J1_9FIRM|nr:hypothetical protein [Wansuia hejianensis]